MRKTRWKSHFGKKNYENLINSNYFDRVRCRARSAAYFPGPSRAAGEVPGGPRTPGKQSGGSPGGRDRVPKLNNMVNFM